MDVVDPPPGDQPIPTDDGTPTLYSPDYGEYYHNLSGAFLEARGRYVEACRVVERATREGKIRILDIGFGLGFNLALAWQAVREGAPTAALEIVTLEKAPISPQMWRSLSGQIPEPEIVEGVAELLETGVYCRGSVSLKFLVGGAEDTIEWGEEGFEAVFLDPFAPDRNAELWTPEFLRAVRMRTIPGAILSTYSSASRVRIALLRAGWTIGMGARVGRKSNGTIAANGEVDPPLPSLHPRVLRRLGKRASEAEVAENQRTDRGPIEGDRSSAH